MVEPEVAYMDLEQDMSLAEDLICFIVERVLNIHQKEIETVLERPTDKLKNVKKPFPRITYSEAIERLNRAGQPVRWGDDFGGDEETALASQFERPVIVHRYPAALKAFYFKRDAADSSLALGMDVLAPEGHGEIVGGGQREDDLAVLEKRLDEHQLPREAFGWYLDLRRYGSVPHSGFGLGLERTVAWLCGLHHVRETIPFARMMERITP
jgi:asparaginyl-tRNA synthetase